MSKIIIATANKGKAKEFEKIFAKFNIEVATLADFPEIGEIEETGTTFAENAALKAETVASVLNQTVIADDSGLIVDALDGAPGVYSARYAGVAHDDAKNNEKLLKNLEGVEPDKRTARFHCTLAVATPSEKTSFYTGEVEVLLPNNFAAQMALAMIHYFSYQNSVLQWQKFQQRKRTKSATELMPLNN